MYFISLNEWLIEADEALLAGTGVPDWASVGLPNGPCLHLWELLSTRYPPESGRESRAEMDLPFDWKAQQSRSSKIRPDSHGESGLVSRGSKGLCSPFRS